MQANKNKGKGSFSFGSVLRGIDRLTTWLYYIISASFIGRIFSAYATSDRVVGRSLVGGIGRSESVKRGRRHYTARRAVACAMERNVLTRTYRGFLRLLCGCTLRMLGVFFLGFGLFTTVMYVLSHFAWKNDVAGWVELVSGVCILPVGVLLLFSVQTLGAALRESCFFNVLLSGCFGISDEHLNENGTGHGLRAYPLLAAAGVATGAVSLLTGPGFLLFLAVAILLIFMVLAVPETGVLLLLLALPFAGYVPGNEELLWMLSVLLLVSYAGKLLRGNRIFRPEAQDFAVLLLLPFCLFSAFSVAGAGVGAGRHALLSCCLVLAYFPTVNIIATDRWLLRCRVALAFSACVASVIGIVRFAMTASLLSELGTFEMSEAGRAVTVGFTDSTAFAYYLVLAFAVTFPSVFKVKRVLRPFLGAVCALMASAVVLSWVQSAWAALLVIITVFALVYEKRSLPVLFFGSTLGTGIFFLLPKKLRLLGADLFADVAKRAVQRNAVGDAVWHLFFGDANFGTVAGPLRFIFGLGHRGLNAVYPFISEQGSAFLLSHCSFWTVLICEFGVVGAAVFMLLLFLILQNAFSRLRAEGKRPAMAYAGICLVAAVVFLAFFRYAWYDSSALMTFFLSAALVGAGLRVERGGRVYQGDLMMEQAGTEAELSYRPVEKEASR